MRKAEAERYRRLSALGCVACRKNGRYSQAEIHHLNTGGHAGHKRRGWEYTIPLCPAHHRGIMWREVDHGPSLAMQPRRFREVFGSDDELLEATNKLLEEGVTLGLLW